MSQSIYEINKSPRIQKLVDKLFEKLPEIESDRAVLLTESYKETEGQPIIVRRAKAFSHILKNIPITIREDELIVGSATKSPRSCQVFPEFSYEWLEKEFDTVETRSADPFYISEDNKEILREVYKYWKGKTTSELATSYMADETIRAMEHNIKRGDIFYVDFGVTVGSVQGRLRPVVILQNDTGNKHSPTLIVATITSKSNKKRELPTHIVFNMDGLTKESIVQLEQITTIDKQQLINYVGKMPQSVMEEINKAAKISLALE